MSNLLFTYKANHICNKITGKRESAESLLYSSDRKVWSKAVSNEYGRLAQGNIHGEKSTNTINFIPFNQVPSNRQVTYGSMIFDHRPLKPEPNRCRLVVGGNKLIYKEDASTPTTNMTEIKLLLNSVISDGWKGAKFCSADLKDCI